MYTETYLTNPKLLQKRISQLHLKRRNSKKNIRRTKQLTQAQRLRIHSKTNGRCHFCGIKLKINNFQADHIVSHTRGGEHSEDNYLPSCFTCNNYRWHYLPRELQIILKLGVWLRTEIENQSLIGKDVAARFSRREKTRVKRNIK